MPRNFQCPRCGEPEEITGARTDSGIVLTCDSCAYSWPRDEVPHCATCAGADVRITYRKILALGRASVTSEVGRQETFVCGTCDAEAIARWTDHGHSLPPEYITAAVDANAAHHRSGESPPAAAQVGDAGPPDDLESERVFLTQAKNALAAMHAEVIGTETPQITSEDSDEIYQNTVYRLAREKRAGLLTDVADMPLYFGRLDLGTHPVTTTPPREHQYVGRRHVRDASGRPLVLDWRAPASRAFYQARRSEPQGVVRRRRYGFDDHATLTGFEDELLVTADDTANTVAGDAAVDALLAAEIERPRSGPMRDIIATIQPEQDDLVRAPETPSICVQGAPGTGKTAVGLHRLAYLLFTERERLTGSVLVVGPNDSFLRYISRVLPALGEVDVRQTTVGELVGRQWTATRDDAPDAARLKGDPRMTDVLRRAVWAAVGHTWAEVTYAPGGVRYRLTEQEVAAAAAQIVNTGRRYDVGRKALARRLAHLLLAQMEAQAIVTDDRTLGAAARSREVTRAVGAVWPVRTPASTLHGLLTDPDTLARAADGILTSQEQDVLLADRPGPSARTARWSPADVVLLDELQFVLRPESPVIRHLVIDEAQNLSAMECRALARRCAGSFTVLGDVAQATAPGAIADWAELTKHLGVPDARVEELGRGYRVPRQVLDLASRLLPRIAPDLAPPGSLRDLPGSLILNRTSADRLPYEVARACREMADGGGSVAVIADDDAAGPLRDALVVEGIDATLLGEPSADAAGPGPSDSSTTYAAPDVTVVPVMLAKGLEFDGVVLVEPADIADGHDRGLQRLYVGLTRAVTRLEVIHTGELPELLRDKPVVSAPLAQKV
ncbi:ATP-binding domain-containing protein [Promicromonospora sp. NPDC023987]|uniref:HelD family protein n=1 Tax=Promicromonospora sp. NPDC023987 TaxID=3155360 RepID=UPI0034069C63